MPTARAVYDLVGSNVEKNRLDKIAVYLKKNGGKAQKRDILRSTRFTKKEFDEAIEAMIESGEIEVRSDDPNGKRGRPKVWVLLKEFSVNSVITVNKVINVNKVNHDRSVELNERDTRDECDNSDDIDKNDKNLDGSIEKVEQKRECGEGHKGIAQSHDSSKKGDSSGLLEFKSGMKKRICLMCGQHFSYDLGIHYNGGYICARCHREGPPPEPEKADSQTKLEDRG
jgi:hypothetical protein